MSIVFDAKTLGMVASKGASAIENVGSTEKPDAAKPQDNSVAPVAEKKAESITESVAEEAAKSSNQDKSEMSGEAEKFISYDFDKDEPTLADATKPAEPEKPPMRYMKHDEENLSRRDLVDFTKGELADLMRRGKISVDEYGNELDRRNDIMGLNVE